MSRRVRTVHPSIGATKSRQQPPRGPGLNPDVTRERPSGVNLTPRVAMTPRAPGNVTRATGAPSIVATSAFTRGLLGLGGRVTSRSPRGETEGAPRGPSYRRVVRPDTSEYR